MELSLEALRKGDIGLQFEQYVPCKTLTDLRSLAYKFAELNHFPNTPKKGTYRPKEMVLGSRDETHK